jgi:hypothetical protein
MCLSHMAFGGLLEYYGGDTESAGWTLSREHLLAEELENLDAADFNERRSEMLKAKTGGPPQPTLPAPGGTEVALPSRPGLPPGAPVNLRSLALLRRREQEE